MELQDQGSETAASVAALQQQGKDVVNSLGAMEESFKIVIESVKKDDHRHTDVSRSRSLVLTILQPRALLFSTG